MVHFHVISVFPESLESYLASSLLKRATDSNLAKFSLYNVRDYTTDKHTKVDDRPYGGGPGMVLFAEPFIRAIEATGVSSDTPIIFFTPHGEAFSNEIAEELKTEGDVVLICGHYEGIDARIKEVFPMRDISIGNYVLTGGELPALVVIDAVVRRIPGVLGNESSLEETRIAGKEVYTRPECFEYGKKEYCVPEVLKSGNHKEIDEFRGK